MTKIRIKIDRVVSISIGIETYWKKFLDINKNKSWLEYIGKKRIESIRIVTEWQNIEIDWKQLISIKISIKIDWNLRQEWELKLIELGKLENSLKTIHLHKEGLEWIELYR